ncbi:hypothetical protein [Caballeronia temeraria]|uniref:hypothetical protein n=1 Tax=Caballeronia temeraria TaxID=1777137 RepID=UPI000941183B|nr:hypothetical protein [Caballeronia temeraria]
MPRATVSHLATTLVEAGLLEHDATCRTCRLSIPVLSAAQAPGRGPKKWCFWSPSATPRVPLCAR